MEAKTSWLLWAAAMAAAVLSQNLAVRVEDQKNYYIPDPSRPTPTVPNLPTISPPHGYGSGGGGGGGHTTPTPSLGGGSQGGTPPANCGKPPTPVGSSSHRHHHRQPTPSPPTGGGGGGGGYHTPPSYTPTPIVLSPPPPTPIVIPGTPGFTIPSPPFSFDPNSPPFNCTYWLNHPTLIWEVCGWWGTTVGAAFGVSSLPGLGANTNIIQALSNTHTDGLGQLYREGTAALLNSMSHTRFPYTTHQVRDSFLAALGSDKAAAAQARVFRMANEGSITKLRN